MEAARRESESRPPEEFSFPSGLGGGMRWSPMDDSDVTVSPGKRVSFSGLTPSRAKRKEWP
jgi:hypothetical protein